MTRLPLALAALPALAVVRLLPENGVGLYLRLAAATAVVLLPGALVARALGRRGAAPTLVWTLALVFAGLVVAFALSASLPVAGAVVAVGGLAALAFALRRPSQPLDRAWIAVLLLGLGFGVALWHVAGEVGGDGLFHLARVRKLVAFDELSTGSLNEFADGGLHPGYAFPLWHGFLALVAWLAGVDPQAVVNHEASLLAPVAFLVAFEAGVALFRSAWLGAATLAAQLGLIALAAGYGGAYVSLALPATAGRQLLVPATLALLFAYVRSPERSLLASLGAAGLALTLVHPTYSLFLLLPIAGFLAVRALVDRRDALRIAAGGAAFAFPAGAVLLWLLPVVRDTASQDPSAAELARALARYGEELVVFTESSYRLAPEVVARSGAVAVAALVLVPLAGFAVRRRWAAFVLGGSLAVLVLMLVPELFTRLSDAVSLSQSRRAAGFVPFAFALAGGAFVLAGLVGPLVLPLALGAGIALQVAYPGDFVLGRAGDGGPALVTWIAALGGAAVLAAAVVARGRGLRVGSEPLAALAASLFVLPVAVHAAASWEPLDRDLTPLPPGLVEALRKEVPERGVVFSDLEASYRIAASAPVYVAAGPPAHVADTDENRPYERREDVIRFFLGGGDLAIPRRYGAGWLVLDRTRWKVRPELPAVYRGARFTLYAVEGAR
jgi:hypothetical protein